jgi:hypothetical protein
VTSTSRHSEAAFETVIEQHLLAHGYVAVPRDGFDRERAHARALRGRHRRGAHGDAPRGQRHPLLALQQGRDGGGAGNPVDPQGRSYRTAYLWEEVLARGSLLDLLARFLHRQVDEC